MAHTLTATGMETKNRLASAGAWLVLVTIDATVPAGASYHLYYTSDESATVWCGLTFSPAAMSFGQVKESLQGDLPTVDMSISNLITELNTAINTYDGLRGATVTLSIVPSGNLAANVAELSETFEVLSTSANNQWITFTMGFADPLGRRFPRDRYTIAVCRHQYRTTLGEITPFCRYTGAEPSGQTTCNRTLKHCQDRGNTSQFGGSPGVDEGVYQ